MSTQVQAPPASGVGGANGHVLEVDGLRTWFQTIDGTVKAVDGVSFSIGRGQTLGVVGESGCGKSVTSLTILGLVGEPGRVEGGEVLFDGRNLLEQPDKELRKIGRLVPKHVTVVVGGRAAGGYRDALAQIGAIRIGSLAEFRKFLKVRQATP